MGFSRFLKNPMGLIKCWSSTGSNNFLEVPLGATSNYVIQASWSSKYCASTNRQKGSGQLCKAEPPVVTDEPKCKDPNGQRGINADRRTKDSKTRITLKGTPPNSATCQGVIEGRLKKKKNEAFRVAKCKASIVLDLIPRVHPRTQLLVRV